MTGPARSMLAPSTRRRFLSFVPVAGAAVAVPAVAEQPERSREELIQHHMDALLGLIRDEFPASTTRMIVTIGCDLTGEAAPYLSVSGLRREWKADDRLRGGGHFVEWSEGDWSPARGLQVWERR